MFYKFTFQQCSPPSFVSSFVLLEKGRMLGNTYDPHCNYVTIAGQRNLGPSLEVSGNLGRGDRISRGTLACLYLGHTLLQDGSHLGLLIPKDFVQEGTALIVIVQQQDAQIPVIWERGCTLVFQG